MNLDRLRHVLDAYGASPERWPEEERDELVELLGREPEAQALVSEATQLDALLDLAGPDAPPDAALARRVLEAAPRANTRPRSWKLLAPLAAAAALALWITNQATGPVPPEPEAPGRIEVQVADLGVYTTPTDVLLVLDGSDPLESIPSYDCEDTGLGCMELEPSSGRHSFTGEGREVKT